MTNPLDKEEYDNGWGKWQNLVLHEIKRLGNCSLSMEEKLDRIEGLVTANKIRLAGISAVLGFIGGAIPVGILLLLKIL